MTVTRPSTTNCLSFDEIIARLSQQDMVDGLLIVGSASEDKLTPASDYDLVIVLSAMPVPLHVGVTYIDNRFTDLIFYTIAQVGQLLAATAPFDFGDWRGRLVDWLETGIIAFDRSGRLHEAQAKVQSGEWILPISDHAPHNARNGINYNLAVVRRLLTSDDPLYLMTADIRMMLYGPQDLFFNYFTIRKLRWTGEKAAIRYLEANDPDYLALFNRFLSAHDRHEKFQLYEELARRLVAPVGQIWRAGDTTMMVDANPVTPEMLAEALDFWEGLVSSAPYKT